MSDELNLTASYRTVDEGWTEGQILELPGVITAAPTREEAEDMLRDATVEYLTSLTTPVAEAEAGSDNQAIRISVSS